MTALQHHVQLVRGQVGRYVLLPGDPGRSAPIAALFDDPRKVAVNREYETWTGSLDGVAVSVVSTGIGCPSTAIAVEELIKVGADTFIRVGTAGSIQPETPNGTLAVVTGAIRDEGTTQHYLPDGFPAVADPQVVDALRGAAVRLGLPHRLGISQSKDSFYGEVEPGRMPMAAHLERRWAAWRAGGAICSEMEAAALFILGSIHGVRTGGVMRMANADGLDLAPLLRCAVEGVRELIRNDRSGRQWP